VNDEKIELLQKKINLIKESKKEINKVTDINQLYLLMDQLNNAVSSVYREIKCQDGCFLCCQHSNIPTASALEWEKIHEFILNSSEEFQNKLIKKNKILFSNYGKELTKIHLAMQSNDEQQKLADLYQFLPIFKGKSCLFLEKGSCSIYPARPAKCRTQGYSLMQFGQNIQFQTCAPEIKRRETELEKQGNRKVLMPFWNDYEQKIQNFQEEFLVTILPIWIFAHIKEEKFLTEVNKKLDFKKILAKFI